METFVFGVWVGFISAMLITYYMIRSARQRAEAMLDNFEQTLQEYKETQIRVRIEKHGDVFYVYDTDGDRFVAQGRNAKEVLDRIPQHQTMRIVSGDAAVVQQFAAGIPQDD